MEPLPLGEIGTTPWAFSPLWFVLLAIAIPAIAWATCAWRRAFAEDPNRIRRAGVREMRRLLAGMRRSRSSPQSRHLHAWLRATARTWGVGVSAPTAAEVSTALHAITGDAAVTSKWRELWRATEQGLFAANAKPPEGWLEKASSAAASVRMPKRERPFPNRLGHWLPSITAMVAVAASVVPGAARAELSEGAAVSDSHLIEAQAAAQAALKSNWNDWAAHHNVAAARIQEADWNVAIAHATASFLQQPASPATRETLHAVLEQTQTADPRLRLMLSGAWYERIPALLSAAGWQRVALASSLLLAIALSTLVLALYVPSTSSLAIKGYSIRRVMLCTGRGGVALGVLLFGLAVVGWSGYGAMNRPDAAILLQNVNLSPAPTDLIPVEETSPFPAGTVVLAQRSFLGWQQVTIGENTSGWIRHNAVMPIYGKRT